MKISELIAKLEEVKKEHGDLNVWNWDGYVCWMMEGEVEVCEETLAGDPTGNKMVQLT